MKNFYTGLLAPFLFLSSCFSANSQTTSNYSFATGTTGSLSDMSSGTTQLIAPDQDDVASSVTNIGFDFFFQGVRYFQFTVNSNGSMRLGSTVVSTTLYDPLAQAGQALITAYGADQRAHAGDGKVHYKVTGTTPNRILVVEWLNMQANFNVGGTADLTYQVRLYETTGVIEYVYGSMSMSTTGAGDTNAQSPQIGFSSNNAVGTVGSVTAAQSGTPTPTFSGASATPVNNLYVAGTITALGSAVDGSRRIFSYASPTPTAPTGLTFSAVGTVSYTLNWTDSPDELAYAIYRSTDGVNFTFDGTAALNVTSYNATILLPATTYFWKVFAKTEGALSTALSGSQATMTPNSVTSVGTGLWSSPGTWSSGSVPTTNDNITIANGHTVTIDMAATALNVTVASGGILQFEQTTARALTIPLAVTIDNGGTFRSNPAGTQTGHFLSIGSDLTNNGTLDFSTNANTAGAIISFTGASNNTFSGTGATTNIRLISVNKGTSSTNIIELMPSNFTVRGVTTDAVIGGWLNMANGTIKVSGTFAGTSRVFGSAGYAIIATAGFWLNNPNYTVAGQNGSPTQSGMLRVSQGTFNIGTATGNAMGFSTGSTTTVEGGAVNASSRFGVAAAGNTITYTQTGGTITVCTIGNASATLGGFDLGTAIASTISITGGTIVTQINSTAIDYRAQSGGGPASITGGTLQFGNAASGAAKTFNIRGVAPNVVVTNTSAGHSAVFSTTLVNYNNSTLNVTVNSGATFNIGNTTLFFFGTTLTNNGTLTASGASSNFVWDRSSGPMTYTGSGTVTAPMTNMSFNTSQTATFDPASSNITVARLNMLSGGPINSNKLTLGNGGATTAVIQFGTNSPTIPVLGFDVPPVFNPGTGGVNLLYTPEVAGRTTGNEIPPSRTLNLLSITNPNNITIAGGDITVNGNAAGAISLNGGRVITGSNTLYFNSAAGTVVQTIGYVDGNFKKSFAAAGSKLFEVGTANGFSPVTVNATAGTFPTDFTVKAVQGPQLNQNPTTSLQRYWVLNGTGITADLTFQYRVGDVMSVEASYDLVKVSGGVSSRFPNGTNGVTINTGAHTVTKTGVSSFSDWTLADPLSPTISSLSPTSAQQNSIVTLTINGDGFQPGSTVLYDGISHAFTFISNLQLTLNLAGADMATTGAKTVVVSNPSGAGAGTSNTLLFTIDPPNVCGSQTTDVAPGASGRATELPGGCAINGVDAVLGHSGAAGSDALIYVASYNSNPTSSPLLDVGGGFVDLRVTNAVAADSVSTIFYYPVAITGTDETGLNLLYYTGSGWQLVTGSGGATPVKNTTDNQNGTTSGGTFTLTFDPTSIPQITDMSGTVFTFSTSLYPLPLTLSSFTARRNGDVNMIQWSTAQEINTHHFILERSTDGRNFNGIGQIAATGNSNSVANYSYTDNNPVKGINYYRLRIVDIDNSNKYSPVRSVRNQGIADVVIYPNPIKDVLKIIINADVAGKGNIVVTGMSGKVVYKKAIRFEKGDNNLQVDLSNVAGGAYIINVLLNDDMIIKKFSKY